jgi:hypothetical protein
VYLSGDDGSYNVKYNNFIYEEDEAMGYKDDCTRLVFDLGETVLKVDTIDSMQGRREYLNYRSIPKRWQKYAAPVYAGGWLASNDIALDVGSSKCERYAWVFQKSIPIVRAYQWRNDISHIIGADEANRIVHQWDDFMQDYHFAVARWCDSGRRQWSVVEDNGVYTPVLHDLGSYWKDDAIDATKRAATWERFTENWGDIEVTLDMNNIYSEAI